MPDPAHDPERRMPRATRGPDEKNFVPKSADTGSSSYESATSSYSNPTHPTGDTDEQGDWLYPWHKRTVLDRLKEEMMRNPYAKGN